MKQFNKIITKCILHIDNISRIVIFAIIFISLFTRISIAMIREMYNIHVSNDSVLTIRPDSHIFPDRRFFCLNTSVFHDFRQLSNYLEILHLNGDYQEYKLF